jgi:hypothetical protein
VLLSFNKITIIENAGVSPAFFYSRLCGGQGRFTIR